MDNKIIPFISQYIDLKEHEKAIINDQNLIKEYKKGDILLSEGEQAIDCYFVMEGMIRTYYLEDGEKKTTEFYTELETINPVSYIKKEPSEYYIEALEDSIVALGNEERNKQLLMNVPRLGEMLLKMNGDLIVENQIELDDFKKMSPEERYKTLLKTRSDLIQRVPQYHLASYLGITPVSLSRMRKRLATKN